MAAVGSSPRTVRPSTAAPGLTGRIRRRRRQRSVRVTVSVSLLGAATGVVLAALPTRSVLWLSLASVSALALSWASLRMMWTEVLQSRRENAADRSAAAAAYRTLFTARVAEHAEFTSAMTERLAEAHLSCRELEGRVALQESRVVDAESQLGDAQQRVQELETLFAGREDERGDEVDELATWDSARPRPRLVKEA